MGETSAPAPAARVLPAPVRVPHVPAPHVPPRPAPREPTARPRAAQAGAPAVFTVVVGQKPSAAQYFVNDHEEVVELCQSLRLHSTRANRNRSLNDLQSHSSKGLWGSPSGSAGRGGGTPPGSGGAPPGSGGAVRMGPLARSLDAQGSSSLVHAHLSSAAAYSAAARRPPPEMVDEGSSVEEWSHRTRPPSMHQKRWDL